MRLSYFLVVGGLLFGNLAYSGPGKDSTQNPASADTAFRQNLLLEGPSSYYLRSSPLFNINKKHILDNDAVPFKPSIHHGK